MDNYRLLTGDSLKSLQSLQSESIQCCITSPPYYGLRDYGISEQIGREESPQAYIARLVDVFREVRRVMKNDGTLWVNIGDTYAANRSYQVPSTKGGDKHSPAQGLSGASKIPDGLKPKDLIGIPWMLAFALRADGWYLRSDIIWHKPNVMPSSVKDRVTTAHEYVFMFSKSERYSYDHIAIQEDAVCAGQTVQLGEKSFSRGQAKGAGVAASGNGLAETYLVKPKRNKRSVWSISTTPYKGAHFAVFPEALVEPCLLAGTSAYGCCVECGASWVRKMQKTEVEDPSAKGSSFDKGKTGARDGGDRTQAGPRYLSKQVGWEASCSCGAATEPCTVLDPFAGAATTGVVALKHGRKFIGLELNPEYVALAEARLQAVQPNG